MGNPCFLQKFPPLLLVYGDNGLVVLLVPRGEDEPLVLARIFDVCTFLVCPGLFVGSVIYPVIMRVFVWFIFCPLWKKYMKKDEPKPVRGLRIWWAIEELNF